MTREKERKQERKKETAGLSARGSLGAPFGRKPSLILSFSIVGHYTLRLRLRLLIRSSNNEKNETWNYLIPSNYF